MTLTTHGGRFGGGQGSVIHGIGDAVAKACAAIIADRPKAFMREAKAFASTQRHGSVERLRELISQYRAERWAGNRHQRVLIVAEVLKLKRARIADAAPVLLAAE